MAGRDGAHETPPAWLLEALAAAGCVNPAAEAAELLRASGDADELARLAGRRAEGVPLEVLVGYADFAGLRIRVRPGVFLPRRRSELLAGAAVELARAAGPGPVVADVCCGTGALAAVVSTGVPGVRVLATDLDEAAVDCARENATTYGFEVRHGDLCSALPADLTGRLAVLVANVPHVPTAELVHLPRDTRAHERPLAHDGGRDGLAVLDRLAGQARDWLRPDGVLVTEVAEHQAPAAGDLLGSAGYAVTAARDDDYRTSVLAARLTSSGRSA